MAGDAAGTGVRFDDLLDFRTGGESLTMGGGPSRIESISTLAAWEKKAVALREIFRQTLGTAPEVSCPLDPEEIESVDCEGYVRRKVAYSLEPKERITAYLLVPRGVKGKAPAVVCIHPTTPLGKEQSIGNDPSERGADRAYALHLVRRGYVTLAYDLLSAGERCYPELRAFDTGPFYKRYPRWSVRGKDLWDLGRAIDFLETVPEVDASRIGSIGHSQGGGITIHGMALDARIRAGVSSCGDWPMRLSKNPFNHARTGWWVGRPFLRPYCATGKPFPIDLHEYLALAAPRAILNLTALNDFQYTLEEEAATRTAYGNLEANVKKVFALYGAEDRFQSVLHTGGHGFAEAQREVAYAFLDRHLGMAQK